MSVLRNHVADQLSRKVSAHGIVVWDDPEQAYVDTAEALVPSDTAFVSYQGSWYSLRREVEGLLAAPEPPRLVVYVPSDPPDEDPLAEVRAATGLDRGFKLLLGTAIRQAYKGRLTEERIADIVASARTLTEAEEIFDEGGGGPVLLTRRLGTSDSIELLVRTASGEADDALADADVRAEANRFLEQQIGGQYGDVADLAGAVSRRILAAALVDAGIDADVIGVDPGTPEQQRRARTVAERWMDDRNRLASLRAQMSSAAEALSLVDTVNWAPGLREADLAPALDDVAFAEYLQLLDEHDFQGAASLAEARLGTFWSTWDVESPWRNRWSLAYSAARVRQLVARSPAPADSPERVLADYEASTWQIDAEHRSLEFGLTKLDELGDLEMPVQQARQAYEMWLDGYLRVFTGLVESQGLAVGDMLRQSEIHDERVAPAIRVGETVAYFFVDALRYELGRELASSLRRAFGEDSVRLEAAVGVAPSITPVGMANLCPGARSGLRLALDDRNKLVVSIDGTPVMSPPLRLSLLQAAHGEVADLILDDVITQGETQLKERIGKAKVLMVRSQEIDESGESGKLAVVNTSFPTILEHLRRAVAKLSLAGVTRFVISSDHGFLLLSRGLSQARIIPKPGGTGDVHRRVFIGSGGAAGQELARIPISAVGIPGDLDLLVPRGLGLISAGGSRGFFHGGVSPQEMLVPVVAVEVEAQGGEEPTTVTAAISGRITSAIFTAKIELRSGLFSVEPLDVGISAVRVSDGAEVAKLLAAGGADMGEGVVRLEPDTEVLLSFQVTASLAKRDKVALMINDVRTDRKIAESRPASVAAVVVVEEAL